MPTLDERNAAILKVRSDAFSQLPGPRVGDWLQTSTGYLRFTHDWGDCIQVTYPHFGDGSFYLSEHGASYSGSLDSPIAKTELTDTGRVRPGRFWFFNHNEARAHNGIDVSVLCRVYARTSELDKL